MRTNSTPKRTREEGVIAHHQALVARRQIPAPYTTVADILGSVEKRIMDHPRGLVGVAEEMGASRKSLWGWLRGLKIPDDKNLARMAAVLAAPITTASSAITVQHGVPIPKRGSYRFGAKGGKSRWGFILDLKPGNCADVRQTARNETCLARPQP